MQNKIFVTLIFAWALLASTFLVYNSFKFFQEYEEWGYLSDAQKRDKIFKNRYSQINFIKQNLKDDIPVYFYTKDGMIFLLSRYYLYPHKTYQVDEYGLSNLMNMENALYLVTFGSEIKMKLPLIASKSADKIYIYKK